MKKQTPLDAWPLWEMACDAWNNVVNIEGMVWFIPVQGSVCLLLTKGRPDFLHFIHIRGCRFVPSTFRKQSDLNIGFQGSALIQGQIYNPDICTWCTLLISFWVVVLWVVTRVGVTIWLSFWWTDAVPRKQGIDSGGEKRADWELVAEICPRWAFY